MSDAYLASECKIPLRFIHAIRTVESNGNVAAVRFEPHIFHRDRPLMRGVPFVCVGYRMLPDKSCTTIQEEWAHHDHHTGAEILAHADPVELATVPYTPGPTRAASKLIVETNRAAFERAYAISKERAVRATSWGAYQVLGWALLQGARSPAEAVAAFDSKPDVVSDTLLVRWCKAHPDAVKAAQRGDVVAWVGYYNGAHGEKAEPYIAKMNRDLRGAQA